MPAYLKELYAHQEWADAEHWRALQGHAAALADKAIRERLHHIHQVQAAFLWVVGPRRERSESGPTLGRMKIKPASRWVPMPA